jgi:predicted alpha/beta hydrolase
MRDAPPRPRAAPSLGRARWRGASAPDADPRQPEEIEIRTSDGWALRADLYEAGGEGAERGGGPPGVAVLAHAFMARRGEFDRQGGGLAPFLAARGWKVVSFDFRGHGGSGPSAREGGSYGYDDLVRGDLPAVMSFARSRVRGKLPVVVLGHSLGGHTSLAAQGTGALGADAIVGFGASPWVAAFEPSRPRWLAKRVLLEGMVRMSRRVGRFPARALGRGSDDESLGCIEDIGRFAGAGAWAGSWASADGRDDYLAALGRVRVPVLQVVSEGDRLECAPACGAELLARCNGGGKRDIVRIAARDDGGAPPGHMAMVTSGRVRDAWARVEEWMRMCASLR